MTAAQRSSPATLPPCPAWCELPAGHRRRTVDGLLVREHQAPLQMPEHQDWPAEWATVFAEERDGVLDLPRGRLRDDCVRPAPGPDGLPVSWKRRAELVGAILLDLCRQCRNNLHTATVFEVTMQAERIRQRASATPDRKVTTTFEVWGHHDPLHLSVVVKEFGAGDSYRFLDGGLLEVTAAGRRRTYSAAAWMHVEDNAPAPEQVQ